MKKEYLNPTMSLLRYFEEDVIATDSNIYAKPADEKDVKDKDSSVSVDMSKIIELK